MKHGLIRVILLLAILAAAQSCEVGYALREEPVPASINSRTSDKGTERGVTSDTDSLTQTAESTSSPEGTHTNHDPSGPCELSYGDRGLSRITVYLGRRWNSNVYWPRTDGDYQKGSVIQFPPSGGIIEIYIVNEYATFSLYITGYNKNVVADRYFFVDDGYYAGVMSFSQYGTQYGAIPYKLVVKPNTTGEVIHSFCDAHWTATRDYEYIGEFHICCRQLSGSQYENVQVELIDIG